MKNKLHDATVSTPDSQEFHEGKVSGPYVGLFYVVAGELYWEGLPAAEAKTSGYVKIYPKAHAAYWDDFLVKQYPALGQYDWERFPRGRVVFSSQEGLYRLQADKCILQDSGLVTAIVSAMRLPQSKVRMSLAMDCECGQCRRQRPIHSNFLDRLLDQRFTTTEDGRDLFFPWGWMGGGYVIPSNREYQKLRRRMALCLKLGVPILMVAILSIVHYAEYVTGSLWMGAVMGLSFGIFAEGCYQLWLSYQYRSLKRTQQK